MSTSVIYKDPGTGSSGFTPTRFRSGMQSMLENYVMPCSVWVRATMFFPCMLSVTATGLIDDRRLHNCRFTLRLIKLIERKYGLSRSQHHHRAVFWWSQVPSTKGESGVYPHVVYLLRRASTDRVMVAKSISSKTTLRTSAPGKSKRSPLARCRFTHTPSTSFQMCRKIAGEPPYAQLLHFPSNSHGGRSCGIGARRR
jgi:hypothetical protein